MKQFLLFPVLCALSLMLLTGCGGGNGSGAAIDASSRGRATVTVHWPEVSRLIPSASNSIRVEIKNTQGTTVGVQTLARPAVGGSTSATFTRLPVGNLTLVATANPNANGTGTAQAKATGPLVVQAGQTTPFSLVLASTIDRIELSPATALSLSAGGTQTITATPKDVSGNTVLTLPQTLQWTTGNAAVATVNAGQVTAVGVGTTQITCRETESNKTVSLSVTVSPAPISWWKAEGNALDSIGNNHGTLTGVGFTTGVSGQAFLFGGGSVGINVPDANSLKLTTLTIDAWVRLTQYPSSSWCMIFFRGDNRNTYDPYYLGVAQGGRLTFGIDQGNKDIGESLNVVAPSLFPLNRWVHVTATFNGVTGVGSLYQDGQLIAQGNTIYRPLQNLDPTQGPGVGIGNHSNTPTPGREFQWIGAIDEVKLYNQVVPPSAP